MSAIAYGTMRLLPARFSDDEIVELFLTALDAGITTFHVSHEYESYPGVCRALKLARDARPGVTVEIVAKIGQPHFDENAFDAARFRALIEGALRDLGSETIDVVQWLVRHTPNDDAPRIATLEAGREALEKVWQELLTEGKVRSLGAFPYSDPFLQRALDLPCVDGIVSYYNERERELEPYFERLALEGRSVLGIRPLCAGTVRDEAGVANAIRHALAPPAVAGTIVGLSSREQIAAAVAIATGRR